MAVFKTVSGRTSHRAAFVLLLLLLSTAAGCSEGNGESRRTPLKVSLAYVASPYSGLIAIAEAKGFFKECGVEVTGKDYPSGLSAVEAMMRGEAQIATGADVVLATKVMEDPSLRVIASIGSSGASEIVVRRDRGIHEPSDLKGKKIGYSAGTTSEYHLSTFLTANNISPGEVERVNIPPEGIVQAIAAGRVDAIAHWEVYIYAAKNTLGANAVSWPAQYFMDYYWLLIAKEELTRTPGLSERFLRALLMAENFLLAHDDEARNILITKWGFEPDFIRMVWNKTRLDVTLNQSLVTSLEEFARWKLNKDGKPDAMPNYLHFIHTGALDAVEPRTVTIFR